jgi:hypothetical protein
MSSLIWTSTRAVAIYRSTALPLGTVSIGYLLPNGRFKNEGSVTVIDE